MTLGSVVNSLDIEAHYRPSSILLITEETELKNFCFYWRMALKNRRWGVGEKSGVTVLILTFKRPQLLKRCVCAALRNEVRPLEIVISDDAISTESRAAVATIKIPAGVTLRHIKGPSKGSQAANAQFAFEAASHEAVVLMHDDDFLFDGAVDHLLALRDRFGDQVDAVYGLQQHVDFQGKVNWKTTHAKNRYYRKDAVEGVQDSRLCCALTGQFPNNGMLVRRSIALAAGYPSESEVGRIPVDYHFALRYALASTGSFVLTQEYTSAYTMEGPSVWRQSPLVRVYNGHLGYEALMKVQAETDAEGRALAAAKDRFAASAVMGHLSAGQHSKAWSIYRAHWQRMDKSWPMRLALGARVVAQRILSSWKRPEWFVKRDRLLK